MMEFETTLLEIEDKEFQEFIHNQIKDFNTRTSLFHREARKPGSIVPLLLILKDAAGNMVGGLSANTYWNWLEIEYFYVPEEMRGKGIGSTILRQAEAVAIERGCTSCFLSTFEFQARVFYEKYGYYVVGKLEDHPPGSAFYWMRKDFIPE